MKKYDIVIIGTGAGLMVMEAALANGLSCAVVEKSKFGGTCLTKGCIPSKMLVYPADLIREFEKAKRIGLHFESPVVDWERISKRVWDQINYSAIMESNLKKVENLTIYNGTGEFTGKNTMRVKSTDGDYFEEFRSDLFVIASGAMSFIPPIKNIDETGYVTYETFFGDKYPKKPWQSLIIVGCGAIGAEFAHIFSAMGTKVTVIEKNPRILPAEEEEISALVEAEFTDNGIRVLTNQKVIESGQSGQLKTLTLQNTITGEQNIVEGEEILLASGLRPTSDLLNIKAAGIKTDEKGWIVTNEYLETNRKGFYAIGDINGLYQFRHKANYEAEILMHNLFSTSAKKRACYSAVPWAIFTSPQVAHVGMTEEQVKMTGKPYWVGKNHYSQIAGGIAMGITNRSRDNGFVKLIVGEEKTILGVHIVGPYASMLVQPFVYLMNIDHKCERSQVKKGTGLVCPQLGSYTPIVDSMVIHPSYNELAAWVIDNIDWSK